MPANYGEDGGKSQSRPSTSLFGREERVEDMVDDLARNADAGVSHSDVDESVLRRAWREPPFFLRQVTVPCLNPELPTRGHRVAGVDAKVHQHLLKLGGVADDVPQVVRRLNQKLDVFRQSLFENSRDTSDQVDRR